MGTCQESLRFRHDPLEVNKEQLEPCGTAARECAREMQKERKWQG